MKRFLTTLVVLAGLAFAVSAWVSRPQFDERLDAAVADAIPIARASEALTFARYRAADGRLRLLLVTAYGGGKVTGYDVEAESQAEAPAPAAGAPAPEPAAAIPPRPSEPDPIALFREFGYEAIEELVTAGATPATIDIGALDLPFPVHEHNIGIGTNYREHAQESMIEETPFVFPKLARPTPFFSDVARGKAALLDYEAELGIVALDDLRGPDPVPKTVGLVLANEVTDRWALVRNLKLGSEMGTTGFADGKSRDGFAPIGPLLVIPRDFETFYRRIELKLWLNGRLRQRELAGNMMWGPAEILRQAYVRRDVEFRYRAGTLSLLPKAGVFPAGTILFSGTPAGVIFKPLNLYNPWVYLRPGDEIVVSANFLGTIRNRIVP